MNTVSPLTSKDLLEAWRLNNEINLYLLDAISDAGMACTMSKRGGRDVARQLVHVHSVRRGWLEAGDPGLSKKVVMLAEDQRPTKARLKTALESSAGAIGQWIAQVVDTGVRMKGFPDPCTALGYFLAHEAHHRGNILLTLKLCGHKVDTRTQYGIWEMWHRKRR